MRPHPRENTTTYRPFLERIGGSPVEDFVGEFGELFYDPTDATIDTLRISDGKTPGGLLLSKSITDNIDNISELIDEVKLEEIRGIITNFLEAEVENFDDLLHKIEDEVDARILADSDLSSRLDTLEEDPTSKKYVDDNFVPLNFNNLPPLAPPT